MSEKAFSYDLGQGKQNSYNNKTDAWIYFKPTIAKASDLFASFCLMYACSCEFNIPSYRLICSHPLPITLAPSQSRREAQN